ncbi:MAG: DUF3726 domain-containing protein [Gammaproteobacteria bacterium]
MRLSNSELLSLLKRALEGSGWTQGRYEEPAHAIWWLECHGINWLENLPNIWPRLIQTGPPMTELVSNHGAESVIDAGSASLLHCGPNSVDLSFANACAEDLASVETRNCTDRMLIVAELATLAKRGASALARWYSKATLHVATIEAGGRFPEYTAFETETGDRIDTTSLFLICSREEDGMNHYRHNLSKLTQSNPVRESHTAEQFRQRSAASRANGIEIPDEAIELLTQAGDRVLVATPE